jgi:hypothetical protein
MNGYGMTPGDRGSPQLLPEGQGTLGTVPRDPAPVAHLSALLVEILFQLRAAFETSKLSSSIWKRVTTSPEIVRMIANCVAVILPVALIRVWSAPMIAARLSLARMSSTSKVTGSVSARISRMKSAAGLAADPGQDPVIALDLESEIGVEQGGDLSRIPAAADPFQKLLCNGDVLLMTHLLSP